MFSSWKRGTSEQLTTLSSIHNANCKLDIFDLSVWWQTNLKVAFDYYVLCCASRGQFLFGVVMKVSVPEWKSSLFSNFHLSPHWAIWRGRVLIKVNKPWLWGDSGIYLSPSTHFLIARLPAETSYGLTLHAIYHTNRCWCGTAYRHLQMLCQNVVVLLKTSADWAVICRGTGHSSSAPSHSE